jgi:hypothetical protein
LRAKRGNLPATWKINPPVIEIAASFHSSQ